MTRSGVERVAGSFRDPAGFVFEDGGELLRQVSKSFAATWDAVVASGLYDELMEEGLLVRHTEVDPAHGNDDAHVVIRPERIPVVSYPYEWTPGQLRDAALLTLEIQKRALGRGMILRDASAYNVQFRSGRPVFIDTLSFEPWDEGTPWVAYGQFCEQFLAPLALQTLVDVRLRRLLTADVGGVPLDLASSLLPLRSRFKPGLLTHVHAHARARRTTAADPDKPGRQASFSANAMIGLVASLRRTVASLDWKPSGTVWADYYGEAAHYTDQTMRAKENVVADAVAQVRPATVWDLGANTGRFARIAADAGAVAVAWDIDVGAVERAWREVRDDPPADGDLLPLVQDLTNPSPGLGWGHDERTALADRGPADLVLALALVHHLAIGNNVPLPSVLGELTRLGDHVLVEWVPKTDEKVRVLLATREDVFDSYNQAEFEAAAAEHADIVHRTELPGSDRVVYLLRSRR